MKKEKFSFLSSAKYCQISAVRYLPDEKPKAILQIAHGMVEFIERYEDFATYLCNLGIMVVGNDHLGHGDSVNSSDDWGYIASKEGYLKILEDMHILCINTKKEYPDTPYFLLGHSMGSFFARLFLIKYGKELDGYIIMGTGQQTKMTVVGGKMICRILAVFRGWKYRSKFVNNMAIGSYNKKWEPSQTHCDWLTKDEKIVNWYAKEPRCQFVFTLNGFYNLFSCLEEIVDNNNLDKMPLDKPVLLVSGEDDPVGDFGKSPQLVFNIFKDKGIKDVELKLYPTDRHEILNETDKNQVYEDIVKWIMKHL